MVASRTAAGRAHRVVGTAVPKTDSPRKITGAAVYASDVSVPNMLYGAVVRSPRPHAKIVSVDTAGVELMPGVRCAVARSDLAGGFDDVVRHYGDIVAAVAATDRDTAVRAAAAIDYELEPLEAVFDPLEALRGDAPRVHKGEPISLRSYDPHPYTVENESYANLANVDDYHSFEVGDVEAGFDDADVVLEGQYATPRVKQCNLDTHCCIAEWDGDGLTLIDPITSPDPARDGLAGFLGVDPETVTIRTPPAVGSSFGGHSILKLSFEPVAASLARETGRPVKLWFDRDEEFVATDTRHPVQYTIAMGVTEAGDITALEIDAVTDTGAYPNGVGHIVLSNSEQRALDLYRIPNYRFEGVSAFTNNLVAGECRGIGSTQIAFALESHVDEVVRKAGLDPLDFRRRNFVDADTVPPTHGQRLGSCGIRECLDRGDKRFRQLRRRSYGGPQWRVGWGVATATHTTGSSKGGPDRGEVRLTLADDGALRLETTAVDQGQGSDTVLAQIVSEVTGVPVERIAVERVPPGDLHGDLGSIASRTTWRIGQAAEDAADRLRVELASRAADRFGVDPDAVELTDGHAAVPDGEAVPVADLLRSDEGGRLVRLGSATSERRPPGYGAHFAEVAVDMETGAVEVLTYVAAQDVGYAINPELVEGQLEGAVLFGVEFALRSEIQLDDGIPLNANLADYPVITPMEMPRVLACEIIEAEEESGPYGAKGVGTPAVPPVAPALLNAVRDATGVRFTAPPADSEIILDGLSR